MKNINTWMIANKLTVNKLKTKCILFSRTNHKTIPIYLNIKLEGTTVERVREINFLGIKIQENLFWKLHMIDLVESLELAWEYL